MARLALGRLRAAGIDPAPIIRRAGLTLGQLEERTAQLPADTQVGFLNLAAQTLDDDLLGFHLAKEFELRRVGLLYFVLASSATLNEALAQFERYSAIANESIVLSCALRNTQEVLFRYRGIARHTDRHQMEFWMTALVRICRHITDERLRPTRISMAHPRCADSTAIERYYGCEITFAAKKDEVVFARRAAQLRLKDAEPFLNEVLVRNCEDVLSRRPIPISPLQAKVANAIAPLLPRGRARVSEVARVLGMSRRTLARRLGDENMTFVKVVEQLRTELAHYYLRDASLSISQIAWLLGFQEVSAFTHSFKRWTGTTPTQVRLQLDAPTTPSGALARNPNGDGYLVVAPTG
jgi:AraC-like DNA-binding protein